MGGRANIRVAQQVPSVEQGLRSPVRYNGGVDQHSNDSSHAPTISAFMKNLWKHPLSRSDENHRAQNTPGRVNTLNTEETVSDVVNRIIAASTRCRW